MSYLARFEHLRRKNVTRQVRLDHSRRLHLLDLVHVDKRLEHLRRSVSLPVAEVVCTVPKSKQLAKAL